MQNTSGKKIGLVLGSGGSKGLAHIGVLKELEKLEIQPDVIVGASIGAMVGGVYAVHPSSKALEKIVRDINWQKVMPLFLDPSIRHGFIKGDKFKRFIQQAIGDATFETTKIKFGAVATDLSNAKAVCLTTGNYVDAIRASISIPLLIKPAIINNTLYVDGGLSMPVPVAFARLLGADIVIAVNLYEHYEGLLVEQKYSANTILYKSTDILSHYLALENVRSADIVVRPEVYAAGLFNKFMTKNGVRETIRAGELAMQAAAPQLRELLNPPPPVKVSVKKRIVAAWKVLRHGL